MLNRRSFLQGLGALLVAPLVGLKKTAPIYTVPSGMTAHVIDTISVPGTMRVIRPNPTIEEVCIREGRIAGFGGKHMSFEQIQAMFAIPEPYRKDARWEINEEALEALKKLGGES